VKGPVEQTNDLIAAVNSLNMKDGVKNGLLVKLNAALAKLLTNDTPPACGALAEFIDLVNAQRGKAITVGAADALIAHATQIRAVIGC
jgi:FIMAH domain